MGGTGWVSLAVAAPGRRHNARRPRGRYALGRRREPLTSRSGIKVAGEEYGQLLDRGFRAIALRGQYH
ncbi:hypothetical protein ABID95_005792 [Streptomyces atratus]